MQVSFKRHLKGSYLIVEEMQAPREKHELRMLLENRICGLLPLQVFEKEKYIEYWYDITGKQSLTSYLEREKIRSDILRGIIYSLKDLCTELTNYFLEENRVSLREDFIYLNYDTKQLSFVYLPFQDGNIYTEFQTLMELIIRKMDHSDKEAVEIGYELYQSAQKVGVGMHELLEQINVKENNAEIISEQMPDETEEELSGNHTLQMKNRSLLDVVLKNNIYRIFREKKTIFLENRIRSHKTKERGLTEETDLKYNKATEQIRIVPVSVPKARLVYQGSFQKEDIVIDKASFLIGNSLETSDGYILHKSISSLQARIERADDIFYLEDMNSENGTYINGRALEYREKVKISINDIITFGTQSYQFTK